MNSQEILYSKGKNDECLTPNYAVKPIIKYIPKDWTIWCPFDKDDSEFVKQLKKEGIKVINSHIENGQDFYNYEPTKNWDCIVSNPPFTNKKQIFERALSFNKPFALVMSNTWLNDSAPMKLFQNKNLEFLFFTKRIKFENNGIVQNKTFASSYYCHNFLPDKIIIEDLDI